MGAQGRTKLTVRSLQSVCPPQHTSQSRPASLGGRGLISRNAATVGWMACDLLVAASHRATWHMSQRDVAPPPRAPATRNRSESRSWTEPQRPTTSTQRGGEQTSDRRRRIGFDARVFLCSEKNASGNACFACFCECDMQGTLGPFSCQATGSAPYPQLMQV